MEHINHLFLPAVRMHQRRFPSGLERGEVHAEAPQAKEIAERALLAFRHAAAVGFGVVRRLNLGETSVAVTAAGGFPLLMGEVTFVWRELGLDIL